MKFCRYGIEWGGPNNDWYYIYPIPNLLEKDVRYWGFQKFYYDGPHYSFGFWFFNISWSTPWGKWNDDDWK